MCAAGHPAEHRLGDAVKAVGMEFCPALGMSIPVGKDSMSMRTAWEHKGKEKSVVAPMSLIISAFSPVLDVRKTLTPQLHVDQGETEIILIDLGLGQNRLGASCLAQVFNQIGDEAADADSAEQLKGFFNTIQLLLAGYCWLITIALMVVCGNANRMAFAGHCGIDIDIAALGENAIAALFNEELGAAIQVKVANKDAVIQAFARAGLSDAVYVIGSINNDDKVRISSGETVLIENDRRYQRLWSETSFRIQLFEIIRIVPNKSLMIIG